VADTAAGQLIKHLLESSSAYHNKGKSLTKGNIPVKMWFSPIGKTPEYQYEVKSRCSFDPHFDSRSKCADLFTNECIIV
jgi:hypothetical protein